MTHVLTDRREDARFLPVSILCPSPSTPLDSISRAQILHHLPKIRVGKAKLCSEVALGATAVSGLEVLQEGGHGGRSYTAQLQHAESLGTEMVGPFIQVQRLRQILTHTLQSCPREDIIIDDLLVGPAHQGENECGQDASTVFAGCGGSKKGHRSS